MASLLPDLGSWMSEQDEEETDRKHCWVCGALGAPKTHVSGTMQCVICDVTWTLFQPDKHGKDKAVMYGGQVLELVDHSKPGTLGSPA